MSMDHDGKLNNIPFDNTDVVVADEEIEALYLGALDMETPDLWDRIESGINIDSSNEIKKNRRGNGVRRWIPLVAAAAVVLIVAIPASGILRRKNMTDNAVQTMDEASDDEMSYETAATAAAEEDFLSENSLGIQGFGATEASAVADTTEAAAAIESTGDSYSSAGLMFGDGENAESYEETGGGQIILTANTNYIIRGQISKNGSDYYISDYVIYTEEGETVSISGAIYSDLLEIENPDTFEKYFSVNEKEEILSFKVYFPYDDRMYIVAFVPD